MQTRSGLSAWEITALAGLVATAIGPVLAMILDRAFAVPGLVFTLIPLVLGTLVLARNRWLMVLVIVMSALLFAAAIRSPYVQARLVNPRTGYFIVAWLQTLGPAAAIVAGLGSLFRGRPVRQQASVSRP